ncbi:CGNR zinc finger domain-containing protein [Streptomyces sp. NPDC052225]|uniref:CGNR zinc finger domain-containing protein n=1 Tax=Streptomyces sp. NPDC052225 TaxID=3154949 RepID=UPI00342ED7F4
MRSATTGADPRPLTGEPLALDLLNTRWRQDGEVHDLLADEAGLGVWLRAAGLDRTPDAATLRHTLSARDALLAAVDGADDGVARVDAVLGHGRIRATLTAAGPGEVPEFEDPARAPGWLAARNYLELLRTAPDRIRPCAHEACLLHFLDTSRNGTRRWCSMALCGNRAKASRHYARSRES